MMIAPFMGKLRLCLRVTVVINAPTRPQHMKYAPTVMEAEFSDGMDGPKHAYGAEIRQLREEYENHNTDKHS